MEFVWAIFFVGAGNVTPVYTSYHFEDYYRCRVAIETIATQRHGDLFLEDRRPSEAFKSLDEELQAQILEAVEHTENTYECIVFNRP